MVKPSPVNALIPLPDDRHILMPEQPNKDEQYRIGLYLEWLELTGADWLAPDLEAYRDWLLQPHTLSIKRGPDAGLMKDVRGKTPATVSAHLATLRGRYQAILRSNPFRRSLYSLTPEDASPADKKAFVDEILVQMQNAIHPTTASVAQITIQDEADSTHLRLKPHQVNALLRAPGIDNRAGLRDTAIFALLACTGIREAELCALDVDDLRQRYGGELALRVRAGKGLKQRLVPYGALDWCLTFVDKWLNVAEIHSGAVFRGLYKGGKSVRPTRISERAINEIFNRYTITIDGDLRDVKPHDLRRTYARNAYERGMDVVRICQNLGHQSIQTTLGYIGTLDADQRRPPELFTPPYDLGTVARVEVE